MIILKPNCNSNSNFYLSLVDRILLIWHVSDINVFFKYASNNNKNSLTCILQTWHSKCRINVQSYLNALTLTYLQAVKDIGEQSVTQFRGQTITLKLVDLLKQNEHFGGVMSMS